MTSQRPICSGLILDIVGLGLLNRYGLSSRYLEPGSRFSGLVLKLKVRNRKPQSADICSCLAYGKAFSLRSSLCSFWVSLCAYQWASSVLETAITPPGPQALRHDSAEDPRPRQLVLPILRWIQKRGRPHPTAAQGRRLVRSEEPANALRKALSRGESPPRQHAIRSDAGRVACVCS